ncbi:hypothetical protein [Erythrobacter tepidarius]|uniref:hypothetical protein n=1 Tax=Erythrobacter tepidarius TaxID=60454 RepID=UPI000A37A6CC|nr:hypothetical protein [Erythrobacter tepidarius]
MTDQAVASFDPNADPRKLAGFGEVVRRRLIAHPAVEQVCSQGAEILLVKGFLKHHFDYMQPGTRLWQREGPRGGQRTWTAMVCLNQPAEGGETDFCKLGLRFGLPTGAMLVWNNMTPDGHPNTLTCHAGLPIRRG